MQTSTRRWPVGQRLTEHLISYALFPPIFALVLWVGREDRKTGGTR